MDETTQQIIALALVALVVVFEILRRRRKKRAAKAKAGCNDCAPAAKQEKTQAVPLKPYRGSKIR